MLTTTARATVVTGPVTEPVTIHDAKRQVQLAASDTNHDVSLLQYIAQAREQWEHDTQEYFIARSMRLTLSCIKEMNFPHRPVTAISAIKYYDLNNSQQTLSSSVYQLDAVNSRLRLAYDQSWPTYLDRWDAIEINYTLGAHTDSTTVPAAAKQAILLLVGYYFAGNRGDDDRANDQRAYEHLVRKYMRSSYP